MEPLSSGKATRTRGADAAASVARAEIVLGVLEGPAREGFKSRLCQCSAKGGHLAVLQWARAQGCPWSEWRCFKHASGDGQFEVVDWLRDSGFDPARHTLLWGDSSPLSSPQATPAYSSL